MPITTTDIQWRFSGGTSGTATTSFQGAISNNSITDNTIDNLFPSVTGPQATAGATHYRLIYVRNAHATIPLTNPKVWIHSNTATGGDQIALCLDPAGPNADSTITGSETSTGTTLNTSPGTFTEPTSGSPLTFTGQLNANGGKQGIWIRRVVVAGAAAVNDNNAEIRVNGETTQ